MTTNYRDKNIVFIGCVEEGKECLKEVIGLGCNIQAIVTFTDELAKKTSGAVSFEDLSEKHGIPLVKVKSTNDEEAVRKIRNLNPDLIFVIGWTRLVSADILSIPRYGCLGMHASLLPKYRGRAPVNWALINNEIETGNSLILLDEGVDTGKVLAQKKIDIKLSDTCDTLYQKVAAAGRAMIRETIPEILNGGIHPLTQDEGEASVMPKRNPDDGIIEWSKPALMLFNWVRALTHPYPGAFTFYKGKKVLVWEARIAHHGKSSREYITAKTLKPGTVVGTEDGLLVLVGGDELISIHRLNVEFEEEQSWPDFVDKYQVVHGDCFDNRGVVTS